jgi:D-alanyl-lipoteichoic acid acyltransferase DltB (MBOAT superfamily)
MNYTDWLFWPLLLGGTLLYWRLGHRGQNRLLLVASYFFYGFWDYRFLFLILLATVIDFIGGLGVAGVRLARSRLLKLGLLLILSQALLYSGIDYGLLTKAIWEGDGAAWRHVVSKLSDWKMLVTAGLFLGYGTALPHLYNLPEQRRRRTFLAISLVSNLAILGFFKYYGFFADSLIRLIQFLGWPNPGWTVLHLILPAGISFYTFQAMSYTIDIYRRQTTPTDHFGDFALFVCFFPHLVAGPIMRAHTLLPQVIQPRKWEAGAFQSGLVLVLLGLFKKVVIADNLSSIANTIFMEFDKQPYPAGLEVLIGLYAFAFQIYGDFSGYSSMARGISKWLGFELAINFHLPYLAENPSDFWRRWHISLSSWLRDYLYVPLGGNRGASGKPTET